MNTAEDHMIWIAGFDEPASSLAWIPPKWIYLGFAPMKDSRMCHLINPYVFKIIISKSLSLSIEKL